MNVLINIADEQYELIRNSDKTSIANQVSKECMMDAIKHGTVLHKKSPTEVCKERADAIYCLKANSDYHKEVCEECEHFAECDHTLCDDINENILNMLDAESNYIAYLKKRADEYPDSFFGDGIRHCLQVIKDFQRGDVSDYVGLK